MFVIPKNSLDTYWSSKTIFNNSVPNLHYIAFPKLFYKRLELGTFRIPVEPRAGQQHVEVDSGELTLMLEGLDLRNARRQPRWYRSPHEPQRTAAVRTS